MKNMFCLDGKNAVVVGGAGGIGQAIAQGLAEFGAQVVIASRKEESLQRAVQEIKEASGKEVSYCTCDATDEDSINDLAKAAEGKIGKIDILVCSQGFNQKFDAVDFPMDVWSNMFDVNVKGVMMCNKVFGKKMKEAGYGKIVNITSVRGAIATFPMKGNAGYCATKGALDMMTRQLASELGPEVTVNGIGPTVTATPMMEKFLNDEAKANIAGSVPMQRMATPEDCVGAAIFLASQASSYVTGQIIYPDGGLTAIG